jgi:hypothetical protein
VVGCPSGSTIPLNVADVVVTRLAVPVVTSGRGRLDVLKVWSAPLVVPEAFVATTRKWYVVLAASDPTAAEAATFAAPAPAFVAGVCAV